MTHRAKALSAEALSDERSGTMKRHISARAIRLATAVVIAGFALGSAGAVVLSVPASHSAKPHTTKVVANNPWPAPTHPAVSGAVATVRR